MLCLSCIDIIFVMQLTNANMTKILTNILGIKSSGMSALQLWDTIKSYITKFVRKGNTQINTQLSFRQTVLSAILPPNSKLLFAKKTVYLVNKRHFLPFFGSRPVIKENIQVYQGCKLGSLCFTLCLLRSKLF